MRIIYLLFGFTLLLSFIPGIETAHAVPKMVKAKSEYLLAEKLLNQVDYSGAIDHAQKAKSLLGNSNSRIEYLLTKAYNAQGKYGKALASLEEFFTVTPESSSGSDEYNEMVALYAEVEILWQQQSEQLEVEKNQREEKRKALQRAISEVPSQMVTIPSGCFKMGRATHFSGKDDERPAHKVCLNSFSIAKYEVTQDLWSAVMGNNHNPSKTFGKTIPYNKDTLVPFRKNPLRTAVGTSPVTMVNWEDVQKFIHKLNSKTGKSYRLPTEAEWEYAARSGGKDEKFSGSKKSDLVGWHEKNSGVTIHPVGQKTANGLGLYDMSGNVWELCQDWYGKKYYQNSPENNPTGPVSGKYRIIRGGSYMQDVKLMRSVLRGRTLPGSRHPNMGLRLVHPQDAE